MEIKLKISPNTGDCMKLASDCLVVGVWQGKRRGRVDEALDVATGGLIGQLAQAGDLPEKLGQCLMLHRPPGISAKRVLLVALGEYEHSNGTSLRKAFAAAAACILKSKARSISWSLTDEDGLGVSAEQAVSIATKALREAAYRFDRYKTVAPGEAIQREVSLLVAPDMVRVGQEGLLAATALCDGIGLAKELANLPCNVCTPTYLADEARRLAAEEGLEVDVLGDSELEAEGMHAFLAVSRGSIEPARLIVLQHKGGAPGVKPIALVGKGVTFDSGGISIKPSAAMDEMKFDMCGAASVFGAMKSIARMKLPINVVAVVPACENMPSSAALKPGEILRSLSGIMIEVLNTDAEGRLILCDALTYVQKRFEPREVVDVATLTGACLVALGNTHSGLYSNNAGLAEALRDAGVAEGDTVWPMPLDEDYQKLVDSKVADIKNDAGRNAGSVTAACFLSRFAKEAPWAHLDIAGTAWNSGGNRLATGRPVPLLVRYLSDRARRAS